MNQSPLINKGISLFAVPTAVHWSQGGVAFITMLAAILLLVAVIKVNTI